MSSPSCRAADNKREEFRRYLERRGVVELMTRAMTALYCEADKPDDPVRYICNFLGYSFATQPRLDALQSELEETRIELAALQDEVSELRKELENFVSVKSEPDTTGNNSGSDVPSTTTVSSGTPNASSEFREPKREC